MKKLLIVLLILGLCAPVMAAEVTFTGATRAMFAYVISDDDSSGVTGSDEGEFDGYKGIIEVPGGQFNSIVANITVNEKVSGRVVIGQSQKDGADTNEDAIFKQAYMTYNFGPGKLSFGHMESPLTNGINLPYTTADGGPWVGFTFYKLRKTQFQLDFGRFSLAVCKNAGGPGIGLNTPTGFPDRDAVIPEIAASYTYANPKLFLKASGGFQTFNVENETDSATITSYAASLAARAKFGPAWVGAAGWYTKNPNNMGFGFGFEPGWGFGVGSLIGSAVVNTNGEVDDATLYGGELGAGFQISPKIGLAAGFVYNFSERDNTADDDMMGWYFNAPINLGAGVSFVPEVGQLIFGDRDGIDQGNTMYISGTFGIFW